MSIKKSQTTIWKERRRCHAQKLAEQGWKQKAIAIALDVSKGAVSQWLKVSKEEGRFGLLARAHTGRPPELANEEKRLIPDYLRMVRNRTGSEARCGLAKGFTR